MLTFIYIIAAAFFISAISFAGVLTLFLKEKLVDKILLFLVAFSAGALMASAFLDLLPEAIEKAQGEDSIFKIFLYLLLGFCSFFVLEHFIKWHHHHSTSHPEMNPSPAAKIMPFSYLILISDGVHNFIDGLIVAGSFIVSFPLGFVTTLAVILHEIPQELGDFGVLVYGGFGKAKALLLNFISGLVAVAGGIIGFFFFGKMEEGILFFLSFAAGNFLYISASDLVPRIRAGADYKKSAINFLFFLAGLVLVGLLTLRLK